MIHEPCPRIQIYDLYPSGPTNGREKTCPWGSTPCFSVAEVVPQVQHQVSVFLWRRFVEAFIFSFGIVQTFLFPRSKKASVVSLRMLMEFKELYWIVLIKGYFALLYLWRYLGPSQFVFSLNVAQSPSKSFLSLLPCARLHFEFQLLERHCSLKAACKHRYECSGKLSCRAQWGQKASLYVLGGQE